VAGGYLRPGSTRALRNLVDADSVGLLREREDRRVNMALIRLAEDSVPQTFDLAHLRAINERLFARVYPWAGEVRSVNISRSEAGEPFVSWYSVESTFGYVAEQIARRSHFARASREEFLVGAA